MDELIDRASRELLTMTAAGASAQQLVEAAYAYIQKPIALVDEIFRVIAFYAPGVAPEDCERKSDTDPVERRAWRTKVGASDEPVIDDRNGGPYRAMCLDVRYAGAAVAKLTIMETTPFQDRDRELLKLLADALALQFLSSRAELSTSRDRERTALLINLLQGKQPLNELSRIMQYLSIPEDNSIRLLIFSPARENAADFSRVRQSLSRLFDAIFAEQDGLLLCVTGAEEFEATRRMITETADETGMKCGVSRAFAGLARVRAYSRQAGAALQTAIHSDALLSCYEDCMMEDLIRLCRSDRDILTFCRPEILALRDWDRQNGTDYLNTLEQYLDSLCSMAETARRTFLHYNTIKYRLKQMEEIAGIRDITARGLWEYLFSIRVLKNQDE